MYACMCVTACIVGSDYWYWDQLQLILPVPCQTLPPSARAALLPSLYWSTPSAHPMQSVCRSQTGELQRAGQGLHPEGQDQGVDGVRLCMYVCGVCRYIATFWMTPTHTHSYTHTCL